MFESCHRHFCIILSWSTQSVKIVWFYFPEWYNQVRILAGERIFKKKKHDKRRFLRSAQVQYVSSVQRIKRYRDKRYRLRQEPKGGAKFLAMWNKIKFDFILETKLVKD